MQVLFCNFEGCVLQLPAVFEFGPRRGVSNERTRTGTGTGGNLFLSPTLYIHVFCRLCLSFFFLLFSFSLFLQVVVSEIRSRAIEKLKHRTFVITDSFSWVYSPKTGELFIAPKPVRGKYDEGEDGSKEGDEREEYLSVGTCFSCCASDLSREQAFFSARTNFSRCSSLVGLEFQDFSKRSIFQELCHCEGWPFGLCRKAVLLPPLPKSPSESWSWRKGARIVKAV